MEQNFYTAVKPLVIIFTLLGIMPHYFKNKILHTSQFNTTYTAFLITIYVIVLYDAFMVVQHKSENTPIASINIFKSVNIIQTIATFVNTILRRKKLTQLSNAMLKCELAFNEIAKIWNKKVYRKIYTHVTLFIIVIVINATMDFYFLSRAYDNKVSAYCIMFGLPLFLNGGTCLLFLMHIWEIRYGFGVLNECLKRMQIKKKSKCFKHKAVLKQKLWIPNVENLATIGTLHLELNNRIKKFNSNFGVLLAAKFVVSFVATLIGIYFIYVNHLRSIPMKIICSAMQAFTYIANFTILCQNCSATVKKVNYN